MLTKVRPYAYPQKGTFAQVITHDGPIIFISNHKNAWSQAMLNRIFLLDAQTPFY